MTRRTVVITGAAAGIGRATALRFARDGYLVGGFDIDATGLAGLADEIRANGGRAHTGVLDVTDADQWRARLAEFAEVAGGRLDVLVNNAGVLSSGPFEQTSIGAHRAMVDVNVAGVVNGCAAGFEYLARTPASVLVNLCSASAIYGQPELATYSATKFAIRGLTEALELEWRRHDVRVLAIWPLFVRTAMTDDMDTGSVGSLGIRLTADDVAETIVRAVTRRPRLLPKVHYPVGRQARAMMLGSRFSPGWLAREINRRISHT
ncbi:SDR family oxidoreductase [Rhodococcus sp. NPDC127528]|uniref:SDR family oxidoreductase n=1 Tax=unclassified Rhodococcus (in: high G+C Gram-positive bacteria) TaxID=192944 RepID=UPI00362898C1